MQLDTFTQAYIEAMLWSSCDDDDEPLDSNYSVSDLHQSAMETIQADCAKFQAENDLSEGTDSQAGHDFWLTRNGHGAGFWDGDWPNTGDTLTAASKAFGECNPYVSNDGIIYL
jgi:hypothetical protein